MKPILDVCCGGRMFYFDKNDDRINFCDIREEKYTLCDGRSFEVAPDTVADFRNLPFEDESFYLVVFDPPHLVRLGRNSWMAKKYGKLDGLRQGVCDAFGGREKEQKANANMLGNNRLVARDRKDNKGAIGGNNAMDASHSVDIRGGNGGVFGLSLACASDRRDQEQTQINQNKKDKR